MLNDVLGSEANVRILRELADATGAVGLAELARRTALEASGVRRATSGLERTGIVEGTHVGPQCLARLRDQHPLAGALRALFAAEAGRAHAVRDAFRRAARALTPPPLAVWQQGPAHGEPDVPDAPLVIGVCTSGAELDRTTAALRDALAPTEHEFDVSVEVRGYTRPDLLTLPDAERAALDAAVPLAGPLPTALMDPRGGPARIQSVATTGPSASHEPPDGPAVDALPSIRSHADLDARGLALAEAVAAKIARDPAVVIRARAALVERLGQASTGEQHELREWQHVLDTMSPARLAQFLRDPGDRAVRLRQTLPFGAVLTPSERDSALRSAEARLTTGTIGAHEASTDEVTR